MPTHTLHSLPYIGNITTLRVTQFTDKLNKDKIHKWSVRIENHENIQKIHKLHLSTIS